MTTRLTPERERWIRAHAKAVDNVVAAELLRELDALENENAAYLSANQILVELLTKKEGELESQVASLRKKLDEPIPMLLFCPMCQFQHVDAPEPGWDNPPHRSHKCKSCGHVWRPCDRATDGVATINTRGEKDGNPAPQRKIVR